MALGGTIRGKKTALRLPVDADLGGYNRWMADLRVRRAHRVWHEPALPATWKERLGGAPKDKQSGLWAVDGGSRPVGLARGGLWRLGGRFGPRQLRVGPGAWGQ